MKMIEITQDDIDNGIRQDSRNCAIAQAIRKRIDIFNKADLQAVYVNGGKQIKIGEKIYVLPKKGREFVGKFDRDKTTAKPFSFALREDKQAISIYGTPSYFTPTPNTYMTNTANWDVFAKV